MHDCDTDSDSEDKEEMERTIDWKKKGPTNDDKIGSVDLSPLTIGHAARVAGVEGRFIMKALFNSRVTGNMIKHLVVPKNTKLMELDKPEGI